MYVNKCTKCGAEFETKNPKRVICPGCLYPDRKPIPLKSYSENINPESNAPEAPQSPQESAPQYPQQERGQDYRRPQKGNYQNRQGGYDRRQYQHGGGGRPPYQQGDRPYQHGGGGRPPYQQGDRPYQQGGGGFRRPPQQGDRPYQQGGGGFRRPPQQGGRPPYQQGGGFRRPQQGGGGFRRPPQQGGRPAAKRSLLISKEQVAEIEKLYKAMLPLPNPDAHEIIGKNLNIEPNKVFFGINLIRQKMFLPKLPYPKRKLAVSPDQLTAIQGLYTQLLPLPPIGCHKFIARQLKMDEWRVHVGIGVLRKQMNLPRWNPDREDAPEEFKKQREEELKAQEAAKAEE